MARLNEFFSLIDFESMRRYFIAYGKTARYTKGECFVEAGQIGRYVGFVTSGYFKYCILNSKGDFAITGFSFADECVMDFTQSFLFDKPSKISIIAGVDSEVCKRHCARFGISSRIMILPLFSTRRRYFWKKHMAVTLIYMKNLPPNDIPKL